MTFGGAGFWKVVGQLGEAEVDRIVGGAIDAGINFIDTANVYSEGESEVLLGKSLARLKRRRDSLVIATKVRGRMGEGANQTGLSRYHIMSSIDESLTRLGLDHVDLYQIHGVDPTTPIEETLDALDDVVRAGKVRYVGLSNLPAWQQMKALALQDANGWARFISAQMYYSIAGRDIEREVVPLALDQGLGIMAWSPLAGGLLSGKFDLEADAKVPGARRSEFDFPPVDRTRAAACLRAMRPIAESHGVSVARVALAWLLAQPHIASVIIGAKTTQQLADNIAAATLAPALTSPQLAALDTVSAMPPEYPGWMVAWQNRDPRIPT